MANNKRAAHGSGTIRKKTVTRNGQDYTYWEARITTGYDAGTGRQKQRSVTGKTQKEVREKLQALAVEVNSGTYQEPCRMTLGDMPIAVDGNIKTATLYAVAYLYEHREDADHHHLMMNLRYLLFGVREPAF